jgi:type I restriction enzyme S subunit
MQESELGKIPEGWEETGFSDWVAIKRGRSITRAKVVPGDVPVVAGGLEPAYYHNEHNVIGPAITISASGANAGYVNLYHQNIWSSDSSYITKQGTPYFYTAYVCLKYYQKAIFDMQTGAAQPHIYPKDFERLKVVVGSDKLLEQLESLLISFFEQSAALKSESESLAQLRDTLLPKLLSGELSVSAAADQITKAEEVVNVQS